MTKKPQKMSECHPAVPAVARKMCNKCYAAWWWQNVGKPRLETTGKVPDIHRSSKSNYSNMKERTAIVYQLEQDTLNDYTNKKIRRCQACTGPLIRWVGETEDVWLSRNFCGSPCEMLAYALGPNWKDLFPGARYQFKRDSPDYCGHCHGLLTSTESGFQCLVCGRSFAVVECLIINQMLQRRDATNS